MTHRSPHGLRFLLDCFSCIHPYLSHLYRLWRRFNRRRWRNANPDSSRPAHADPQSRSQRGLINIRGERHGPDGRHFSVSATAY